MSLNNLRPPKGAKHSKKRVGRGQGSGNGKTAGRGHKGAQSRSGYKFKRGFEGGQMPLHRRVPKRGFHNPFRVEYEVVNLDTLAAKFDAGTIITPEVLRERGMIASGGKRPLKVLARGTPGFSGADLANLVNEAALLAARQDKKIVEMLDFENAKDKVLMGVERRSMIISESEKKTIAYHEAGHALVASIGRLLCQDRTSRAGKRSCACTPAESRWRRT